MRTKTGASALGAFAVLASLGPVGTVWGNGEDGLKEAAARARGVLSSTLGENPAGMDRVQAPPVPDAEPLQGWKGETDCSSWPSVSLCELGAKASRCGGSFARAYKDLLKLDGFDKRILLNLEKTGLRVRFDYSGPHGAVYNSLTKELILKPGGGSALAEALHAIDDALLPDHLWPRVREMARWLLGNPPYSDPAVAEHLRKLAFFGGNGIFDSASDPEFVGEYVAYLHGVRKTGIRLDCSHEREDPVEVYMAVGLEYFRDKASRQELQSTHPKLYDWFERSLKRFAELDDWFLYDVRLDNPLHRPLPGVNDRLRHQARRIFLDAWAGHRTGLAGYCEASVPDLARQD